MGLFGKSATPQMKRCTLDNKLYPTTEFYKNSPYNKSNDDFRRRVNRLTNGAVGVQQVRELFTKLRSVR